MTSLDGYYIYIYDAKFWFGLVVAIEVLNSETGFDRS